MEQHRKQILYKVYISRITMSNEHETFCTGLKRKEIIPILPQKGKHVVIPFFLPYAGCPHRCLFCAQEKQTGHKEKMTSLALSESFARFLCKISAIKTQHGNDVSPDLGFYGGTFTLLPPTDQLAFLQAAKRYKKNGMIHDVRCSTRPDALEREHLSRLRGAGLNLVEAGVQSFDNRALALSRRGYTGETAREGCRAVRAAGLDLGIQLLPGMPGSTPESFLHDVAVALSLKPACLRFYPCLVIRDTPLAALWQKGLYQPWDEATTVSVLGQGLAAAWEAGVPVIRLSLAPEPDLDAAILAGPRHQALGSCIQAEALFVLIAARVQAAGSPPTRLLLPRECQGFFFGHRGSLRPRWQALGINPQRVIWTEAQAALLWENELK